MALSKKGLILKNSGYEITTEKPNRDGWYKLKNKAGFYRGEIDPITGKPGDRNGELQIEYGDTKNKKTVTFTGNISGGLIEGKGKMVWPCGTVYTGEFRGGCRHGKGVLTMPGGTEMLMQYRYGSELRSKFLAVN